MDQINKEAMTYKEQLQGRDVATLFLSYQSIQKKLQSKYSIDLINKRDEITNELLSRLEWKGCDSCEERMACLVHQNMTGLVPGIKCGEKNSLLYNMVVDSTTSCIHHKQKGE